MSNIHILTKASPKALLHQILADVDEIDQVAIVVRTKTQKYGIYWTDMSVETLGMLGLLLSNEAIEWAKKPD